MGPTCAGENSVLTSRERSLSVFNAAWLAVIKISISVIILGSGCDAVAKGMTQGQSAFPPLSGPAWKALGLSGRTITAMAPMGFGAQSFDTIHSGPYGIPRIPFTFRSLGHDYW